MAEVELLKSPTEMTVRKMIGNVNMCSIIVSKWGDKSMFTELENTFTLNRIYVPVQYRRQGHGTELMNALIKDSDENGYILELGVQSDFDTEMTEEELTEFYRKFGFKETEMPQIMVRFPAK